MNGKWFVIALLIMGGCTVRNQPVFDTIKLSMVEVKKAKTEQVVKNSGALEKETPSPATADKTEESPPTQPSYPPRDTVVKEAAPDKKTTHADPLPKENPSRKTFKIVEIEELPNKITEKVRLKKGEYYLEEPLEITTKGSLWIEPGTVIEIEECGIVCYGEIHARGTSKKPIIFRGAEEWENITIWGKAATGEFRHCRFSDGYGRQVKIIKNGEYKLQEGTGLDSFGGALLYGEKSSGKVEKCDFRENYGRGAIALLSVKEVVIGENEIVENDEDGIYCLDGAPNIHDNTLEENKMSGIVCAGKSEAKVKGNSCEKNKIGIEIIDQATPLIVENKCHGNERGILLRNRAAPKIKENEITRNNKVGIGAYDKSGGVIENNVCEGGMVGIVSAGISQPTIRNNTCRGQGQACLAILDQSGAKVENNTLQNCATGMLIHTSAEPKLKDNSIEGCSEEVHKLAPR